MHAASLYYLTHITNVWGCMEILPTHCGAGSVKVNYYRFMMKVWGLVKPHNVNKLQMRLSYCSIYYNTVCNMKKHKKAYTNKAFTSKNRFQDTQWHSVIFVRSVLASRVNNALARCFANLFRARTFQNSAKS